VSQFHRAVMRRIVSVPLSVTLLCLTSTAFAGTSDRTKPDNADLFVTDAPLNVTVNEDALKNKIDEISSEENKDLTEAQRRQQIEAAVRNNTVVPDGECADQYSTAISVFTGLGLFSDAAGLTWEAVAQFVPDLILDLGLTQGAAEAIGIGIQGAGVAFNTVGFIIDEVASAKPNCNAEFTGTVSSWANMTAGMGISAHNGAITLGNPDAVTYADGITLGG